MKTKITLIADDGKILTNGEHYGKIIYLSPKDDGSAWREIAEAEYEALVAAEEGGETDAP